MMKNRMPIALSAWLVLLLANAALAQVTELYRSVGPDGTVTFSDRPQGPNSEKVVIGVERPPPAEQDADTESATSPGDAPAPDIAANSSPEDLAAQIARNCELARQNRDVVANADSLYRVLPDGSRQTLSDDDMAAAREHAEAEVARWCN